MARRQSATGETFLIPFGLVFLLAGLGVGIFYFSILSRWYEARGWVEVPCVIESSDLQERVSTDSDGTSTTYEVEAAYRYEYNGRTYKGDEVSLSLGADSFGDHHQRVFSILDEHRASGRPFRCYVNPDLPEESVIFREARWTILLFMSLFPLVFPLVGGLVSLFGLIGLRQNRRLKDYKTRYPGQPWRWKPAWGEDWMRPKNTGGAWAWVVVTVWMGIIWLPMMHALLVDGDAGMSNPLSLLAFLPAVAILLVGRGALKRLLASRRGEILLYVEPRPVSPGKVFQGYLGIPKHLTLGLHDVVETEVRCVKEVTVRSGKNTTVRREVLWSGLNQAAMSEAAREGAGSRLPLRQEIPAGLPAMPVALAETGWKDATQHVWELEVRANKLRQPMVYDLPVFEMEPAQVSADGFREDRPQKKATPLLDLDADELVMHLKRYHVAAEFDGREYPVSMDLSPKRFAPVRLFLVIFTSVWTVAFIILLNSDAPGLFPLIWGGSSAMLWWMIVMQMKRKRLRFTDDGLEVAWSLGPWGGRQVYERRHLVQFLNSVNMSSGSTQYHVVKAETTFGKKVILLDGIPSALVVENLCRLLERWRKQA
ncbi:DUF3592 domain-containing protein [Prosthecobacter sp. SYSU 5D2]|uniref:DUF3592 domain-containing protein n=1 Tax=Prosthecobacter sp. SYSU 5D2 TaxID=3134134 RepID=UPI0031FEDB4C